MQDMMFDCWGLWEVVNGLAGWVDSSLLGWSHGDSRYHDARKGYI